MYNNINYYFTGSAFIDPRQNASPKTQKPNNGNRYVIERLSQIYFIQPRHCRMNREKWFPKIRKGRRGVL